MNDPKTNDQNSDPEELISRALRGTLSPEEERLFNERLNHEPALRERITEERRLEQLLERAPKLPVPTNFTSLVLQSVRQQRQRGREVPPGGWFGFRFARVATGMAVVVAAGFFALQQYRQSEREQMVRSVTAFTEVASVISSEQAPATAVFQDFEAIQRLSLPQENELDFELLAALQK